LIVVVDDWTYRGNSRIVGRVGTSLRLTGRERA
jgi:hypothetical protein